MSNYGNGVIEIPLDEFYAFVDKYNSNKDNNNVYGVPRINMDNGTLDLNYMFNSEIDPHDEFDYDTSTVAKEWETLKNKNQ